MIIVTRLHGASVAVNCDLIERVEATPDTVVTLVDGSRYVVRESVSEIVDKVRAFRASVVLLAGRLDQQPAAGQHLRLVPNPDPEATAFWWNVYLAATDCDATARRVADAAGTIVLGRWTCSTGAAWPPSPTRSGPSSR